MIKTRKQAKAAAAATVTTKPVAKKTLPRSPEIIERVKDVLDQLAIDTYRDKVFRRAVLQELIAEASDRLTNLGG